MRKLIGKFSIFLEKFPFLKFVLGSIPGAATGLYILYYFTKENQEIWSLVQISVIAFLAKESVSFIMHKWWTFQELEREELKKEILLYFFITVLLLLLNTSMFYLLTSKLSIDGFLSQLLINITFALINFWETKKVFVKT